MSDLSRRGPAPRGDGDAIREVAAGLAHLEGPLLPILHAVQERFGWVDDEAVATVAEVLNLSRAEVHGVVSFYHDFRRRPAGRHVVKVCRAEACQSLGCERLAATLERTLGISFGETTPDGRVTLEAVYCLGNCALGPAALVDGRPIGRADADRIGRLVSESRR